MEFRSNLIYILIIYAGFFIFLPSKPVMGEEYSLEQIFGAWEEREENVKSFYILWEFSEVRTKDSFPYITEMAENSDSPIPPDTLAIKGKISLWVSGNAMRLETERPQWDVAKGRNVDTKILSSYDGDNFSGRASPMGLSHPQLAIYDEDRHPDWDLIPARPVIMAFRILNPKFTSLSKRSDYKIIGHTNFNGEDCIILDYVKGRSNGTTILPVRNEIWVCPNMNFSIVRNIKYVEEMVENDIQIQMERKDGQIWIPVEWRRVKTFNKKVLRSEIGKCLTFTLNPPLEKEFFILNQEPGMVVENFRTGENYLVKEDGSRRPILFGADTGPGVTIEDIRMTEPGEARWAKENRRSRKFKTILPIINIVVLVLIITIFIKDKIKG
jgi:hypothetical protein